MLCVACDKEAVSRAFKAMEADEKKALNQAYGKFQSFLSIHEAPKCEEAIQLIWDVIDHNNWDYNPRINLLLGLMQLAHGDFSSASESFFYADNDRYAYCAAYQGTEMSDDKKLYQLAASFASVYLTGKDTTNLSEAIEVLQKSSVFASDISGIEYARKHCSADVMTVLDETIRSLAENYIKSRDELSDIEKLLEKLRAHYPNTEIGSMITDYLGKLPEKVVTIKEEATNDEPDLTKEYEGKLVSYKFYEDKGKIENDNGEQYVFRAKTVADFNFISVRYIIITNIIINSEIVVDIIILISVSRNPWFCFCWFLLHLRFFLQRFQLFQKLRFQSFHFLFDVVHPHSTPLSSASAICTNTPGTSAQYFSTTAL